MINAFVASILYAVALLASSLVLACARVEVIDGGSVLSDSASSAVCSGESPESWYGRTYAQFHAQSLRSARSTIESVGAGIRDHANIIYGSLEASLDPRQLKVQELTDRYSVEDLRCWSLEGDQLASLGYALSPDKAISPQDRVQALERASVGAEPFLRGVTRVPFPTGCNEELAAGNVHCEFGLPEAQFQLAMQRGGSSTRISCTEWLRRAYLGGLWPAQGHLSNCGSEQ